MADKRSVEIRDLGEYVAVSAPRISPDGKKVIFVHTKMDLEEDTYHNNLWMADLESKKTYQFTSGRGKDKNPSWSPDGSQIMLALLVHFEDLNGRRFP